MSTTPVRVLYGGRGSRNVLIHPERIGVEGIRNSRGEAAEIAPASGEIAVRTYEALLVVEHKTTMLDIGPGSDSQVVAHLIVERQSTPDVPSVRWVSKAEDVLQRRTGTT